MTVSVNIETGRRDRALTVPNDAVTTASDGRTSVLVLRGGRAERVPIELGLRGLALSEVTSGLADGDVVLAEPALADGDRARARLSAAPLD
jgi:HlyD family secretion protein